jgi:hypothetical protein
VLDDGVIEQHAGVLRTFKKRVKIDFVKCRYAAGSAHGDLPGLEWPGSA